MKLSVSVVIPYYKNEKYFSRAYFSVLNQTYKPNEIIVICDEPAKQAKLFLKKIIKSDRKKTKLIFNKKNYGVSYCRNFAIKIAKSKFIAFLDSDDYWHREKLKKQINFIKKNKLDFCHTSYHIINEQNQIFSKFLIPKKISFNQLIKRCDVGTSSVIAKKKLLLKYKFPNLSNQEDYYVWLKIAQRKKNLYGLLTPLTYWRKTKGSLSSNNLNKLKNAFYIYHKKFGYNIALSIYRLLILILLNIKKKTKIYL